MSELIECPFCGKREFHREVYHDVDGVDIPYLFCESCGATITGIDALADDCFCGINGTRTQQEGGVK